MTYSPAFDTVVTREAAWFTTDPPGNIGGFTFAPNPLLASNGGAWDVVQGYWTSVDERTHELYIVRTRTIESRDLQTVGTLGGGMGGMKGWKHSITVYAYWPIEDPAGSLENEQQAFDGALADVVTRIRGPFGDKTHGGQFAAVGEAADSDVIDVRFDDVRTAQSQGQPLSAQIIYSAYDAFTA